MGTLKISVSHGEQLQQKFLTEAGHVIFSKDHELRLSLICFLAQGHLLIEDVPGVGKTTFVKTVGKLLGLQFGRIQFTNDLLPGDILGSSIYDPEAKSFKFHKGPIFSELLLIDELNRATPKTQSALLQAMEERQVTVDGKTIALPNPFFIIATQNPRYQIGTFSLPESQLDRFLMRIRLGYPGADAEKALLMGEDAHTRLEKLTTLLSREDLEIVRLQCSKVFVSEAVAGYVQRILEKSRVTQKDIMGLSPRAGISLVAAAKAAAYLSGRDHVIPEDIQEVAVGVFNHRISHMETSYKGAADLATELVNSIEVD